MRLSIPYLLCHRNQQVKSKSSTLNLEKCVFVSDFVCFLSIACEFYSTRKPVRNSFDDLLPAEPRHGFCAGTVQRHLLEKSANVKDQFFVYKSCLKHAKNKFFITFVIGCKKSKLWFCA